MYLLYWYGEGLRITTCFVWEECIHERKTQPNIVLYKVVMSIIGYKHI